MQPAEIVLITVLCIGVASILAVLLVVLPMTNSWPYSITASRREKTQKTQSNNKVIGLLLTRDDVPILTDWLERYRPSFREIFALDGSKESREESRELLVKHNVRYHHDDEFAFTKKTDHSLRKVLFDKIHEYVKEDREGEEDTYWIVIAHPDEFYLDKLQRVADRAEREGHSLVIYNALHNFPHVSEIEAYRRSPSHKAFKHFVHDGRKTFKEWRMFRYDPKQHYGTEHGFGVQPFGIEGSTAPWNPSYLHYKIRDLRPQRYENGKLTWSHWSSLESHYPRGRVFERLEDFFLEKPAGLYEGQQTFRAGEDAELPKDLRVDV